MAVPQTKPKLLSFKFQNDHLVWCWIKFLVLSLLLACSSQLVVSNSLVNTLPGFQGSLPFELETGYVGVDEPEDVQLFYYFVKSESYPKEDPSGALAKWRPWLLFHLCVSFMKLGGGHTAPEFKTIECFLTNLCNLFGATANSESESPQITGNIRQHYKGQVYDSHLWFQQKNCQQ